jgi:CheY-like chemotaxis protein/HPt (histidine-containing phosphotransfer) domain-containing protein
MKSKKILVVDDNDLNRKLFENLIGQHFSFESAKNGLEAIALTEAHDFDLILMDIQMPQMDGITAMKKIRQKNKYCPILAVTAYAEESERESFLQQGFDEFITKPIQPKEFIKLIQDYLLGSGNGKTSEESSQKNSGDILNKKLINQLLKYNSKSVIKKVFDDFLTECAEAEVLIDEYHSNHSSLDLLEKIHTIKGNSGTLGAMRIYTFATQAEEYGRKENYSLFDREVKNLKNEIGQFRDFLKQEPIFET